MATEHPSWETAVTLNLLELQAASAKNAVKTISKEWKYNSWKRATLAIGKALAAQEIADALREEARCSYAAAAS
jgi:hypothetical protein